MNSAELEAAIEQANRIFSRRNPSNREPREERAEERIRRESSAPAPQRFWPPASFDMEKRFAQPHAKLFPFIGRKVRTPAGTGMLLQVFAKRVMVVLDSEMSRCSFFPPAEVQPVSWELP